MGLWRPVLLGDQHRTDGFESIRPDMDRWLCNKAKSEQYKKHQKTFVSIDEHENVVGFFQLSKGVLSRKSKAIPVVIMNRIGFDARCSEDLPPALLRSAIEHASILGLAWNACILISFKSGDSGNLLSEHGFKSSAVAEMMYFRLNHFQ